VVVCSIFMRYLLKMCLILMFLLVVVNCLLRLISIGDVSVF